MVRKGMGKGTGKGYKNIVGVDSRIHSQSAKGIKQPQRINPIINKTNKFNNVIDVSLYLKGTGLRAVEVGDGRFRLMGSENDIYETFNLNDVTKSSFKTIKDNAIKIQSEITKEKDRVVNFLNKNLKNKQVIIKGKRWFEKTNGNTYHSTEVYIDGELIGKVPFSYGYGDQYGTTGFKILQDKGFVPKLSKILKEKNKGSNIPYYGFREFTRDNRKNFNFFVDDVTRKRDL